MQIFYKKHFKRNLLFDALVWIGIKFAFLFRSKPEVNSYEIERYALIFDQLPVKLASMLTRPIELNPDLKTIKNNTEIIFGANSLSYKKIIGHISNNDLNGKVSFKIHPKSSTFIIGSNSSKSRGEVIPLD